MAGPMGCFLVGRLNGGTAGANLNPGLNESLVNRCRQGGVSRTPFRCEPHTYPDSHLLMPSTLPGWKELFERAKARDLLG